MDEQLPGRLRNVQVILEKPVNGEQRLFIQRVNGVLLENLLQKHLAKRRRQLVNQPANAQVFIVNHILLRIENLAHVNGNLRFLIGFCQIPQVHGNGADTYHNHALAVGPQTLLNGNRNLVQLLEPRAVGHLPDQNHVPFSHVQNEIVLPVRVHGLNHVRRHRLALPQRPHYKYAPGQIGGHAQFLCPHINVAQHDIIRNNILDKGPAVVLFLIIGLGRVQGHRRHGTNRLAHIVLPKGKGGVIKLIPPAVEGLEGFAIV